MKICLQGISNRANIGKINMFVIKAFQQSTAFLFFYFIKVFSFYNVVNFKDTGLELNPFYTGV